MSFWIELNQLPNYQIRPYSIPTFSYFFEELAVGIGAEDSPITFDYKDREVELLWQEIYSRYYLKPIAFHDFNSKKEMDEIEKDVRKFGDFILNSASAFFRRLVSIINRTNDYYLTLLNGYTSAKDNLLADIKTTTKSLSTYNDTPQGETVGTSYMGDEYLTRVDQGTSEVSTPLTTLMNRLTEIQNSYKSILNDWTNDFKGLFLEENI